jgi:hypothetical protein
VNVLLHVGDIVDVFALEALRQPANLAETHARDTDAVRCARHQVGARHEAEHQQQDSKDCKHR